MPSSGRSRVLVIKLGAFGDLVQSFDACAALRAHHAGAELVLMTGPAYQPLTAAMPWFDRVWLDDRPSLWRPGAWWDVRKRFVAEDFTRVYDLQCSRRTARYFHLLPRARRPQWVGAARGCSHPNPAFAPGLSNREKMAAQLAGAGVPPHGPADLSWLTGPTDQLGLPECFALLIPGCSPHRPRKRWPAEHYGALARRLAEHGFASVMVGTAADRGALDGVRAAAPGVLDLGGRTSLLQLGEVARRARLVVGNDTGATFLAAALGTPTLMLMSADTDAAISAPGGAHARWLQRATLAELTVDHVEQEVARL